MGIYGNFILADDPTILNWLYIRFTNYTFIFIILFYFQGFYRWNWRIWIWPRSRPASHSYFNTLRGSNWSTFTPRWEAATRNLFMISLKVAWSQKAFPFGSNLPQKRCQITTENTTQLKWFDTFLGRFEQKWKTFWD